MCARGVHALPAQKMERLSHKLLHLNNAANHEEKMRKGWEGNKSESEKSEKAPAPPFLKKTFSTLEVVMMVK